MKHKAILFDLDGTLINTLEDLTDCMNIALGEFACPEITTEQCRPLLGVGLLYLCENSLPTGRAGEAQMLMQRFRQIYNEHFLDKSAPYQGIMELTDELAYNGIKQAVITNKNEDISKVMIRQVFGEQKFPIVRGAINGIGCKPAPETTLQVLSQLDVSPEEALFVGDGEADLDVAKNAGIKSVWASWGFRKIEELEGRIPDFQINLPSDLLKLL